MSGSAAVVDASVLAPALIDDGAEGERSRHLLRGVELTAPALIDLEVTSVFRGLVLSGQITDHRSALAIADLVAMPIERAPHQALVGRIWQLRDNLTVYDASYVALAELLGVPLLTADAKLAGAPGVRCAVELVR